MVALGDAAPEMISPLSPSSGKVPEVVGGGRFTVKEKIGSGCFGEVRVGVDTETGEAVAVKFEEFLSGFLDHEVAILRSIQQNGPQQGFARLMYSGRETGGYKCMVMELLGDNLLQRMSAAGDALPTKTVILVAEQALHCLEYLHSKGIAHRDIKPENFVTGRGDRAHHVHLVDFGLAAEFIYGKSHIEQRQLPGFHGNFRYASLDAHQCLTQSRRSDLESLGYMLIFLCAGRLPWSGFTAKDWRVKNQRILAMKTATDPAVLAEGLPEAFYLFLSHARGLAFQDRPDYEAAYTWFLQARESVGKLEGAEVEDHHVQWVDAAAGDEDLAPLDFPGEVRQLDDPLRWSLPRLKSFRSLRSSRRPTLPATQSPGACLTASERDQDAETYALGETTRARRQMRCQTAQPHPSMHSKSATLCFPSRLCGRHMKVSEPTASTASTTDTSPVPSERHSPSPCSPEEFPEFIDRARPGGK